MKGAAMAIRTLTTPQEWLEADRLIATAFLEPWDEEKSAKKVQAQAEGTEPRPERTWGLTGDDGTLAAAATTLDRQAYFGGTTADVGELAMVGSSVGSRGSGNVRALMAEILTDFKARGCTFAELIPFSASFYRKFGFELTSHSMKQRVPIEQLADFSCGFRATRVEREEDVAAVRALYDSFARTRCLAPVRTDDDWTWRGNGEFGARGFLLGDFRHDTYVLWDEADDPRAYVKFAFRHEPDKPFFGELVVCDLAYDGHESFLAVLGLLYRLRAKAGHVTLDLHDDIDLATFLPEGGEVERTAQTWVMLRVLDVCRALELMPSPAQAKPWVLAVDDAFMPENSGAYRISYGAGEAQVGRCDASPDLYVSIQTLALLVAGRIGLEGALFREGTELLGNQKLLARVFTRHASHLQM